MLVWHHYFAIFSATRHIHDTLTPSVNIMIYRRSCVCVCGFRWQPGWSKGHRFDDDQAIHVPAFKNQILYFVSKTRWDVFVIITIDWTLCGGAYTRCLAMNSSKIDWVLLVKTDSTTSPPHTYNNNSFAHQTGYLWANRLSQCKFAVQPMRQFPHSTHLKRTEFLPRPECG